jgi:uncharacterized protein YjbI with pentapeptide repeats
MSNNYFDEEIFNEESFQKILPLRQGEFVGCTFSSIDFTSVNLAVHKFIECKFENCNLSNVSVKNTTFRDCHFSKCKLVGINFAETATLSTPQFHECVLDYAVFQSLNLSGCQFKTCSMKEVDFYECNLTKSSFTNSSLEAAVFNKANLKEADLRGAYDYSIDPKETILRKARFNLPEALCLLRSLDIILE